MISNSNNTSGKALIAAGMMALCVVSACPVGVYARAPQQKQSEQQLKTITGVIVDARTHEPLIGATVMVKGTAVGTASDIDGNFSINVVPGSTLLVSYTGYQSLECKASDNMTISLTESTSNLDEVVVVGYGVQKKGTLTGSVSSVKGSDLKTSGVANVTNTFAGQIPGVVANTRSGEPGSDWSNIYIRGKGTLNDNSPLIIIDGVANRDGLERLNPNDIESINVLKDASAAIYGAEAANGVILVTTKRGTIQKPTITYNGTFSLQQNTRQPNLMNAYENMVWSDEISKYKGQTAQFENIKGGYLDGTINRDQYGDTDWMKVVFRKATPSTRHSLALNGGNDRVRYYISGDYSYQEPNYRNTKLNYQTYQCDPTLTHRYSAT